MRLGPTGRMRTLETEWMADAACAQIPGLPWIESPRRVPDLVVALMGEVCAGCPVLDRCAAFVEEAHVTAGFWAGRSRNHLNVDDYTLGEGGEAA